MGDLELDLSGVSAYCFELENLSIYICLATFYA